MGRLRLRTVTKWLQTPIRNRRHFRVIFNISCNTSRTLSSLASITIIIERITSSRSAGFLHARAFITSTNTDDYHSDRLKGMIGTVAFITLIAFNIAFL